MLATEVCDDGRLAAAGAPAWRERASSARAVVIAALPQNGFGFPAPVTQGHKGQEPSARCAASTAAISVALGSGIEQSHCAHPRRSFVCGQAIANGGSAFCSNPARRAAWAIVAGEQ